MVGSQDVKIEIEGGWLTSGAIAGEGKEIPAGAPDRVDALAGLQKDLEHRDVPAVRVGRGDRDGAARRDAKPAAVEHEGVEAFRVAVVLVARTSTATPLSKADGK